MENACTVISINATGGNLLIDGDPNWDDQQLKIDRVVIHSAYTQADGQSVACSVDWPNSTGDELMMGICFVGPNNRGENTNNYMMSIGQNSNGLMDVTEVYPLKPLSFKYTVVAQTKWELVLRFEKL